MKKTTDQILLEKLDRFQERCDHLLDTLDAIAILNNNFENQGEAVLDVGSPEWQMFFNDLLSFTKNYKGYLGTDFERFTIMFNKATKYPNSQNVGNLKVAIYLLKNQIQDTLEDEEHLTGIWSFIHPQIASISMSKFDDGYYADAVESAFKEVNTRVKNIYLKKTGEEKDGSDLMRKAFSPNAPILTFESLDTQSGKSVQQGYMDIFAGAMTGIRNPKAHQNMDITEKDAVQRLMLASLLMSKIDEAIEYTDIIE